jgi:hypothetical protein
MILYDLAKSRHAYQNYRWYSVGYQNQELLFGIIRLDLASRAILFDYVHSGCVEIEES